MDNKVKADLIGEFLYSVRKNETELAIQLFIEDIVVPENVASYSKDEIKNYILTYLDSK